MLIHVPYESISLHTQHWHYFKIIRFLFNYTFFQNIYSDTPSVWIHLKFRILSRLIWVHLFWKNNHQKTHACKKNPLTQPHCTGSSVNLCLLVIHNVCRTSIIYKVITGFSRMDLPTLFSYTSPFLNQGLHGGIYIFLFRF